MTTRRRVTGRIWRVTFCELFRDLESEGDSDDKFSVLSVEETKVFLFIKGSLDVPASNILRVRQL